MSKGNPYAKTQVMTASPERLLLLLLRACRRNLAAAAYYLENDDRAGAQEPLHKASEIVYELCRTLDPSQNKELTDNLADVYANVSARLLRALTTHDAAHVREAEMLFLPVADAFEDVIEQHESGAQPRAPGAEVSP